MLRSSGLVLVFAIGACGDNIGGNVTDAPSVIDSPVAIDARIDAGPLVAMRAATIAVSDVTVLGAGASAVGGVRGGSSILSFTDLTAGGGRVVSGISAIGGCVVTEFSPATPPNTAVDAGAITIANEPPAEAPATGLLKTVGPCTFMGAAGYRCISHGSGSTTIVATNPGAPVPPGIIAYTIPAQTFPAAGELIGSYLNVNGFADPNFNSGASAFPVVSQTGTTTLSVVNPMGELSVTDTAGTGSFAVLNAFAPVPGAGAASNFLGTGEVRITKAADPDWGAIDQVVGVVGEGFAIDSNSDDPSAVPTALPVAAPLTFACDGLDDVPNTGDDTCGDTASVTTLRAIIISGRATQQPVGALPVDFLMPTENPATNTWREWQCAYLLSRSAELTAEALTAILGGEVSPAVFTPTRIEMRVLFVAGSTPNGPNPGDTMTGRILVGHGIVGHTDP